MSSRLLESLATLLAGPVHQWNSRRPLCLPDFDLIYPTHEFIDPDWRLPCLRRRKNEKLRTWFALTYPFLDLDDVLYAIDMELLHIHHKGRRLLWSKNMEHCGFDVVSENDPDPPQPKLFLQYPKGKLRVRRDDWVLLLVARADDPSQLPHFPTEIVIDFFVQRFGPWRFINGEVPCPAGTSLLELDDFQASTHWVKFTFIDRARKAAIGDWNELNRVMLRNNGKAHIGAIQSALAAGVITPAHLEPAFDMMLDNNDPLPLFGKSAVEAITRAHLIITDHAVGGHVPVQLHDIWDVEGPNGESVAREVRNNAIPGTPVAENSADNADGAGKPTKKKRAKPGQASAAWRANLSVGQILTVAKNLRRQREKVGFDATDMAASVGVPLGGWETEIAMAMTRLMAKESQKPEGDDEESEKPEKEDDEDIGMAE